MAKIEIPLPKKFHYKTEIQIRKNDVFMGLAKPHVGFDTLLTLVREAYHRFLDDHGYNITTIEGTMIIMPNSTMQYISEVFMEDILIFDVGVDNIGSKSFEFIFRATKKANGLEAFRSRLSLIFFDYDKQEVVAVPDAFKKRFS